jgi:hypothetical protein
MNSDFQNEAKEFVKRNPDSIKYFVDHGNSLEKAIAETFLEAAGDNK